MGLLIGAGVFGIALFVGVRMLVLRQQEKQRRGEELHPFASRSWRAVSLDGLELRSRYVPASHNKGREVRPPALELSLPCPSNGCFYLSAEKPRDRWLLRLGLTREARCQVPDLDESFFVATPSPLAVGSLLQDSRAAGALRGLMAEGVRELDHDGEALVARIVPFRKDVRVASLPEAERAALHLRSLAAAVPSYLQGEDAVGARAFARARGLLVKPEAVVAALLPAVAGLVAVVLAVGLYPPLETTDTRDLAATCAAAGLAGAYLLGHCLGRRYCLPAAPLLLWALCGGSLLGLLAFSGTLFYNGRWDQGPAAEHTAWVVEKGYRTNKGERSYYVRVRSWKDSGRRYKFKVREDVYARLVPLEAGMSVVTRPGALGIEWVVRTRPILYLKGHRQDSKFPDFQ